MTKLYSSQDPEETKDEVNRLQLQHELIEAFCNGLVKAPIDLTRPGQRILDSATADGHWMRRMQTIMPPGTEFVGFDILPVVQNPNNPFPPQIRTVLRSVLDPLPAEWTNAFDLVHQRLLLVLFSDEEVARILQGLISCVKPGGWIQLFEGSGKRLHDPRAKYFGTFYDLAERKLQNIEVGGRLGDSLRKAGLVNIHHETVDFNIGCSNPDKELGEKGARNILSIFDMWQNETSREEISLSQEEWENLGRLALEDMRTYRTEMRYHIVWAQKPVDGF
ncbi:hypothetical protein IFM61606_01914 [Aspergillus udagawae]|uniref:Uncharacterized protein n=1 Tax=Aspergillus udagawae TaxID=91492 RepID=A0ABQ1ADP8_9EURO|nr:hypothetical protein IFM51744_02147 [Aspergillus udagawae]GFF79668.1 hypothetical protein IFM53868_02658 [Aspergillus udagawae]GFG16848.1 hypothetical protein IFM5058_08168 [Aspergillus udagawae]GFG22060.1 hypothetical protein IFM61606_01914 [Aspergillus udagawae]